MVKWWRLCWLVAAWSGATLAGPRPRLDSPAAYEVDTTVLLNDVARRDKEVGYKIRANLQLVPVWADAPTDFLLEFRLHSPKLYLRGKHANAVFMPYDSVWDSYSDTTFYAHWSHGLIKTAYLDPSELPDVLNYKKSLLSLFQFQMLDGEHNETDLSGPCSVLYESISMQVFRKIKKRCDVDALGGVSGARRLARYTLAPEQDTLQELHAEELLTVGDAQLGLKARAWQRLSAAAAPAPAGRAPSLAAALLALPSALRPLPLALQSQEPPPAPAPPADELRVALEESAAALGASGAGAGGDLSAASAALRLLPPLRAANHSALLQLLQRDDMLDALPGLCQLLGLTATLAAHSAARDFLQLHTREPLHELAQVYLAAFALADAPEEDAVREVLRLGEEGRAPAVRDAALLAAAAAAQPARPALQLAVRDALVRGLARCAAAACRALRLRALANLRRADTAELLLEHAERGGAPAAHALDALHALPPSALTFARLDRLGALALDERAPLELRAAALDLVTQRRATLPAPLASLAYALHARGPHELRRVLWQRMAALAPHHEPLRALPAMLEPHMRGWDAQAHSGTSSVLVRSTGWAAAGRSADLESVQVASGGLLRRGTVRLLVAGDDALTVQVWTRGLDAFSGGDGGDGGAGSAGSAGSAGGDGGAAAEQPAGGLALAVAGVRLREIALFDGQAELLGHVWAGTASSPTPALRALRVLADTRAHLPLLGGARLRAGWRAALALALDAQAQVSLWWRTARTELELRAAVAAEARADVRTAWGELRARAAAHVEPRLRIAADLDFYDAVALCVRARTEPHETSRTVTLRSEQGARRLRVRRRRSVRAGAEGRTLALGRPNDVTCRTLRSQDAPAAG